MSSELAVKSSPFDPQNLTEAMSLAKTLASSQLIPRALVGKPQDVLLIMIKGRELGLSTMQSLSGINVIQGKPVMESSLMIGLILSHSEICEFFTLMKSDEKIATYKTKRRGAGEVELSFTIEEAEKAKLTGKDNWKNFAPAMLRARASAALGRAVYPDLLAGVYVPGEIPSDEPRRELTVELDETAGNPPPSLFKTEPEWDSNSQQHKEATAEHAHKMAKFTSGSMKGQHFEAAPLDFLVKFRDHLQKSIDDGRNTMPNLMAVQAANFWIAIKKNSETPVQVAPETYEDFTTEESKNAEIAAE